MFDELNEASAEDELRVIRQHLTRLVFRAQPLDRSNKRLYSTGSLNPDPCRGREANLTQPAVTHQVQARMLSSEAL